MLSPPMLMTFVYLTLGLATTTAAWYSMADEIELAISLDLEQDDHVPTFRILVTVVFVLCWPVLLAEVMRKR
jgi:hypothetical protein